MSISPRKRTENANEALRIMLGIVGDGRLNWTLFEPSNQRFGQTFRTTWEELERAQCIKQMSAWDYEFTARGWITALEAAGTLCNSEMKDKLGKLCAAIKRRCEEGGRHRDATTIQELAQETGFSEVGIPL